MQRVLIVAAWILLTHWQAAAAEPGGSKVGLRLGDPQRLQFVGVTSFPVEEVRDALRKEFDYQFASHPSGVRADFIAKTCELLRRGYRHCGFPDVDVTPKYDAARDQLTLSVREGRRYLAGKVNVVDGQGIDEQRFIALLTEGIPKTSLRDIVGGSARKPAENSDAKQATLETPDEGTSESLWRPGEPVAFDEETARRRQKQVTAALAELGYFDAKAGVRIEPQRESGGANLVVEIERLGPPALIGEIVIEGLSKSTREELLGYLGLEVGGRVSRALLRSVPERLRAAARYWSYGITPEPMEEGSGRIRLTIKLVEYPLAPGLAGEFTPHQKLLLKMGRHLEALPTSEDELAVSVSSLGFKTDLGSIDSVRCVLSTGRGMLLRCSGTWAGERQAEYAVVLSPEAIGLFAGGRREKYVGEFFNQTVTIDLKIEPKKVTGEPDFQGNFSFSAGLKGRGEDSDAGRAAFNLQVDPVVMVRDASHEGVTVTSRDNGTIFESKGRKLIVETETGRLVEYSTIDSDTGQRTRVTVERGAFEREWSALADAYQAAANYYHPAVPFGSLAAFLSDEWLWISTAAEADSEVHRLRLSFYSRILDQTLVPILRKETWGEENSEDEFDIPSNWNPDPSVMNNTVNMFFVIATRLIPCEADRLFPRGSWPWTLVREAGFFLHGRREHTASETKRLLGSDKLGPLGCLALGKALESVNPRAAWLFAFKARARGYSLVELHKDTSLLLEGDTATTRVLVELARFLEQCPPEELAAVAPLLPDWTADWLVDCGQKLRGERDRPTEQVLIEVLDDLWQKGLRDLTARGIDELLQTTAPGS